MGTRHHLQYKSRYDTQTNLPGPQGPFSLGPLRPCPPACPPNSPPAKKNKQLDRPHRRNTTNSRSRTHTHLLQSISRYGGLLQALIPHDSNALDKQCLCLADRDCLCPPQRRPLSGIESVCPRQSVSLPRTESIFVRDREWLCPGQRVSLSDQNAKKNRKREMVMKHGFWQLNEISWRLHRLKSQGALNGTLKQV